MANQSLSRAYHQSSIGPTCAETFRVLFRKRKAIGSKATRSSDTNIEHLIPMEEQATRVHRFRIRAKSTRT